MKEEKIVMKVGDKVRVKSDLKIDTEYGDADFIEEMAVFLGKEAKILEELYEDNYDLDIDKEHEFTFTTEMLDLVESV